MCTKVSRDNSVEIKVLEETPMCLLSGPFEMPMSQSKLQASRVLSDWKRLSVVDFKEAASVFIKSRLLSVQRRGRKENNVTDLMERKSIRTFLRETDSGHNFHQMATPHKS